MWSTTLEKLKITSTVKKLKKNKEANKYSYTFYTILVRTITYDSYI